MNESGLAVRVRKDIVVPEEGRRGDQLSKARRERQKQYIVWSSKSGYSKHR